MISFGLSAELSMMKHITIKHISNLHRDALKALFLYREELNIFQERLEEIAAANTGLEASMGIEHFQNLFIIHREQINEIINLLEDNLHTISIETMANAGYFDEPLLLINYRLNEQFLDEERLFREMKAEFYQFAAKWM